MNNYQIDHNKKPEDIREGDLVIILKEEIIMDCPITHPEDFNSNSPKLLPGHVLQVCLNEYDTILHNNIDNTQSFAVYDGMCYILNMKNKGILFEFIHKTNIR